MPIYEDVRYAQTISEEELNYHTLHNPTHLYKGGFSAKYNVGEFQFTTPVMDSTVARALFTLYFKNVPESFSLFYIENGVTVKLNTCVVDRITFNLAKDAIITATISGNYSYSDNSILSGTDQGSQGSLYTYIEGIGVTLNSVAITNLTEFSLEMSNTVSWIENSYMHDTGPSYATEFYCSEKSMSGNFTRNEDLNLPSYLDNVPLLVQIKSGGATFLEFDFASVISSTRPQLDTIIKKGFDFRINSNSGNQVKYKGVNIL